MGAEGGCLLLCLALLAAAEPGEWGGPAEGSGARELQVATLPEIRDSRFRRGKRPGMASSRLPSPRGQRLSDWQSNVLEREAENPVGKRPNEEKRGLLGDGEGGEGGRCCPMGEALPGTDIFRIGRGSLARK